MKKQILVVSMSFLAACGGGSSTTPTAMATPTPPPPNAAVTASGVGDLVVHPSAVAAFGLAFEAPTRVRETGGGTADWNFVRLQFFTNGREIERTEGGSDVIRAAGVSRVNPNSDATYRLALRFNSDDFDDLTITLGFTDVATGRAFTANVPLSSFNDITISVTPLLREAAGGDSARMRALEASLARVRERMAHQR
ncbi:MAG: hypothetical protein ABI672_08300 [Vicinamibacteria bacterium]